MEDLSRAGEPDTRFWWWGQQEPPEETYSDMGRTCKLHVRLFHAARRSLMSAEIILPSFSMFNF